MSLRFRPGCIPGCVCRAAAIESEPLFERGTFLFFAPFRLIGVALTLMNTNYLWAMRVDLCEFEA